MRFMLVLFFVYVIHTIAAQTRTFVREFTYKASDFDSKMSCRAIVINELRFELLNEVGVYIESERILKTTEVGSRFTQDFLENIVTLTAGITKLRIIEERWNGEEFWMRAQITIDKKDLERSLNQLIENRNKVKELEEVKAKLSKATEELNHLRNKMEQSISNSEDSLFQTDQNNYSRIVEKLNFSDYFYSGYEMLEVKEFWKSIEYFTKAIEIDPNDGYAFGNRGLARSYVGDFKGAISDYSKAIEIDPNDYITYVNRGVSKSDIGDYKGAIADFDMALKMEPKAGAAYNNRGSVNFKLGKFKEAMIDYDRAIDINPLDDDAFNNRGNLKMQLKDYQGAMVDYNRAIDINQLNEDAYYNRAIMRAEHLDNINGAIDDFNAAIQINPGFSNAYGNRGYCKWRYMQDLMGAMEDYNRAIEINPNLGGVFLHRGLLKLELKDNEAGCKDLKRAIELGEKKAQKLVKRDCK